MPLHHRPYLDSYECTTDDKERRLKLARRFTKAGQPSEQLLDAVFWVEPDVEGIFEDGEDETERYRRAEDRLRLRVQRNKKEMPWYIWIIKWGYPPGWIASKGEQALFCKGQWVNMADPKIRCKKRSDESSWSL